MRNQCKPLKSSRAPEISPTTYALSQLTQTQPEWAPKSPQWDPSGLNLFRNQEPNANLAVVGTKLATWDVCSGIESQIGWLWRELPDEWIAKMRIRDQIDSK